MFEVRSRGYINTHAELTNASVDALKAGRNELERQGKSRHTGTSFVPLKEGLWILYANNTPSPHTISDQILNAVAVIRETDKEFER